jgi:D-arabinose 5-phosphate isomerase GutQ
VISAQRVESSEAGVHEWGCGRRGEVASGLLAVLATSGYNEYFLSSVSKRLRPTKPFS